MKYKPLISTITIFFNCEKFIEEAIESVLAQTYNNWELLLVDNGSSDGSTAITLQYSQKYPQIHYLQHPNHQNRGISATRNLGICNALGEYIAFLDADNVWLPQKLEQQLATMQSQPEADIVFGLTQHWYSWTGNSEDAKRDSLRKIDIQPNKLLHPPNLLPLLLKQKANTPGTCSILIRRSIVEEIGGFEETFGGMYEDQAFFAKVYFKASVYVETKCWVKYRQHPDFNCAIGEKTGKYHSYNKLNPAYERYLSWMVEYLLKQQVKDAKIWRSVKKALWPFRYQKLYSLSYLLKRIFNKVKYRLHLLIN